MMLSLRLPFNNIGGKHTPDTCGKNEGVLLQCNVGAQQ